MMTSSIHQTLQQLCKHIATDITPRNGWLQRSITQLDELEKNQPYMLILHKLDSDKNNIFLGSRFKNWLGLRSKSGITNPETLLGYICPHEPPRLALYFHHFKVNQGQDYTHALRIARRGQNFEWLVACSARVWKNETEPTVVITLLKPLEELLAEQTPASKSADKFALSIYEMLSARERQVLRLLAKGMNDAQAAAELNISKLTVKTYRQELRRKFKVTNSAGLAVYATKLKI